MGDKRSASRRRTYLSAQLTFPSCGGSLDCVVRNLGPGGAMIEISLPPALDQLELRIPTWRLHKRAQVAWRMGPRLGLTFTHDLANGVGRSAPKIDNLHD